jgi:hypothetical protein
VSKRYVSRMTLTTELVVKGQQLTMDFHICSGQTGRYKWRASAGKLKLALLGGTWTRRR